MIRVVDITSIRFLRMIYGIEFMLETPGGFGYDTAEQAMAALDQDLIENGWTFLTQEQWDKYQLLF